MTRCTCGENPHTKLCPALRERLECGCAVIKQVTGRFENGAFVTDEINLEENYCAKHLIERRQRKTAPVDDSTPDDDTDNVNTLQEKFFCESVLRDSTGKETILFLIDSEQRHGTLIAVIDPAAPGKFVPGRSYFLTFSEVPEEA